MKIRNILLIPVLFIVMASGFFSCGVDRWPEYSQETEFDRWIDSVMRQEYLWYQEMPSSKNLNFFSPPETFLNTLLYKAQDNTYSHIDTLREAPLPSYGFNYTLYTNAKVDTLQNALITYVLPNSPASRAGLERGQWFVKVNGEKITKKNATKLLGTGQAMKLTLGKYEIQKEETGVGEDKKVKEIGIVKETGVIADLGAEVPVEDNPINYKGILTSATGKKVGYLVYSHFTAGTYADKEKYNNELREISKEFADAGITYFILDLRYNTGGTLECAQLLSTLLAPSSALGSTFARLEYNNKQAAKNRALTYDSELLGSTGKNMNIVNGIILTGSTTAGMTGTMFNCLSPLNKWMLIGSSIVCPGVATESFAHPKFRWTLNPVVCKVYNSKDESGMGGTFKPTYTATENSDLTKFLPFGNKEEVLLSIALGVIDGTYPPKEEKPTTKAMPVKSVNKAHSSENKRGVRLK